MNRSKIEFIFIVTFYYKYLNINKKIFTLGISFVFKIYSFQRFCRSVKRKSQLEHGQPMEQTRGLLQVRIGFGSLSTTTPVSLLANEFDVRSVLRGQVSLAAVNQICVIYEAMNGCKNLKIHYRISLKM